MMDNEINEQTEILKEILRWTKIAGIDKIKKILEDEFKEENKISVYSLSDGKSSDEIEKLLNKKVTDMSVRNWWKKWGKMGIMEIHPNYKKRLVKIFDLGDFGILIPKVNTVKNKENSEEIEKEEN